MPDLTSPIGHTKHGDLSLDQIADLMPGMARLMLEISDRYWILYYAAQGGNWDLARHQFGEIRKAMQSAGVTRPKYQEPLAGFEKEKLMPILSAIRAKDWPAFEVAYNDCASAANEMHVEFGYGYVDWQLPPEPPKHLRLTES